MLRTIQNENICRKPKLKPYLKVNVKYFHIDFIFFPINNQVFTTKRKINITMLLKRTSLWCISSSRYLSWKLKVESCLEIMFRLMSLVMVSVHKLLQGNCGLRPHYFQSFGPLGFHPKLLTLPQTGGNQLISRKCFPGTHGVSVPAIIKNDLDWFHFPNRRIAGPVPRLQSHLWHWDCLLVHTTSLPQNCRQQVPKVHWNVLIIKEILLFSVF